MGYPSLSKLTNVYGDTNYNGDFTALRKTPTFNALSTLTATLSLKWPDVGLSVGLNKDADQLKPIPNWLSINNKGLLLRKRRGIFDSVASFFQLSLSSEIPLITFANLEPCTKTCQNATLFSTKIKRSLEASVQSKFGDLKTRFVGFNLENQYDVPFKLNLPKTSFCLPYLDVCSSEF
jgi:hypothetical protein